MLIKRKFVCLSLTILLIEALTICVHAKSLPLSGGRTNSRKKIKSKTHRSKSNSRKHLQNEPEIYTLPKPIKLIQNSPQKPDNLEKPYLNDVEYNLRLRQLMEELVLRSHMENKHEITTQQYLDTKYTQEPNKINKKNQSPYSFSDNNSSVIKIDNKAQEPLHNSLIKDSLFDYVLLEYMTKTKQNLENIENGNSTSSADHQKIRQQLEFLQKNADKFKKFQQVQDRSKNSTSQTQLNNLEEMEQFLENFLTTNLNATSLNSKSNTQNDTITDKEILIHNKFTQHSKISNVPQQNTAESTTQMSQSANDLNVTIHYNGSGVLSGPKYNYSAPISLAEFLKKINSKENPNIEVKSYNNNTSSLILNPNVTDNTSTMGLETSTVLPNLSNTETILKTNESTETTTNLLDIQTKSHLEKLSDSEKPIILTKQNMESMIRENSTTTEINLNRKSNASSNNANINAISNIFENISNETQTTNSSNKYFVLKSNITLSVLDINRNISNIKHQDHHVLLMDDSTKDNIKPNNSATHDLSGIDIEKQLLSNTSESSVEAFDMTTENLATYSKTPTQTSRDGNSNLKIDYQQQNTHVFHQPLETKTTNNKYNSTHSINVKLANDKDWNPTLSRESFVPKENVEFNAPTKWIPELTTLTNEPEVNSTASDSNIDFISNSIKLKPTELKHPTHSEMDVPTEDDEITDTRELTKHLTTAAANLILTNNSNEDVTTEVPYRDTTLNSIESEIPSATIMSNPLTLTETTTENYVNYFTTESPQNNKISSTEMLINETEDVKHLDKLSNSSNNIGSGENNENLFTTVSSKFLDEVSTTEIPATESSFDVPTINNNEYLYDGIDHTDFPFTSDISNSNITFDNVIENIIDQGINANTSIDDKINDLLPTTVLNKNNTISVSKNDEILEYQKENNTEVFSENNSNVQPSSTEMEYIDINSNEFLIEQTTQLPPTTTTLNLTSIEDFSTHENNLKIKNINFNENEPTTTNVPAIQKTTDFIDSPTTTGILNYDISFDKTTEPMSAIGYQNDLLTTTEIPDHTTSDTSTEVPRITTTEVPNNDEEYLLKNPLSKSKPTIRIAELLSILPSSVNESLKDSEVTQTSQSLNNELPIAIVEEIDISNEDDYYEQQSTENDMELKQTTESQPTKDYSNIQTSEEPLPLASTEINNVSISADSADYDVSTTTASSQETTEFPTNDSSIGQISYTTEFDYYYGSTENSNETTTEISDKNDSPLTIVHTDIDSLKSVESDNSNTVGNSELIINSDSTFKLLDNVELPTTIIPKIENLNLNQFESNTLKSDEQENHIEPHSDNMGKAKLNDSVSIITIHSEQKSGNIVDDFLSESQFLRNGSDVYQYTTPPIEYFTISPKELFNNENIQDEYTEIPDSQNIVEEYLLTSTTTDANNDNNEILLKNLNKTGFDANESEILSTEVYEYTTPPSEYFTSPPKDELFNFGMETKSLVKIQSIEGQNDNNMHSLELNISKLSLNAINEIHANFNTQNGTKTLLAPTAIPEEQNSTDEYLDITSLDYNNELIIPNSNTLEGVFDIKDIYEQSTSHQASSKNYSSKFVLENNSTGSFKDIKENVNEISELKIIKDVASTVVDKTENVNITPLTLELTNIVMNIKKNDSEMTTSILNVLESELSAGDEDQTKFMNKNNSSQIIFGNEKAVFTEDLIEHEILKTTNNNIQDTPVNEINDSKVTDMKQSTIFLGPATVDTKDNPSVVRLQSYVPKISLSFENSSAQIILENQTADNKLLDLNNNTEDFGTNMDTNFLKIINGSSTKASSMSIEDSNAFSLQTTSGLYEHDYDLQEDFTKEENSKMDYRDVQNTPNTDISNISINPYLQINMSSVDKNSLSLSHTISDTLEDYTNDKTLEFNYNKTSNWQHIVEDSKIVPKDSNITQGNKMLPTSLFQHIKNSSIETLNIGYSDSLEYSLPNNIPNENKTKILVAAETEAPTITFDTADSMEEDDDEQNTESLKASNEFEFSLSNNITNINKPKIMDSTETEVSKIIFDTADSMYDDDYEEYTEIPESQNTLNDYYTLVNNVDYNITGDKQSASESTFNISDILITSNFEASKKAETTSTDTDENEISLLKENKPNSTTDDTNATFVGNVLLTHDTKTNFSLEDLTENENIEEEYTKIPYSQNIENEYLITPTTTDSNDDNVDILVTNQNSILNNLNESSFHEPANISKDAIDSFISNPSGKNTHQIVFETKETSSWLDLHEEENLETILTDIPSVKNKDEDTSGMTSNNSHVASVDSIDFNKNGLNFTETANTTFHDITDSQIIQDVNVTPPNDVVEIVTEVVWLTQSISYKKPSIIIENVPYETSITGSLYTISNDLTNTTQIKILKPEDKSDHLNELIAIIGSSLQESTQSNEHPQQKKHENDNLKDYNRTKEHSQQKIQEDVTLTVNCHTPTTSFSMPSTPSSASTMAVAAEDDVTEADEEETEVNNRSTVIEKTIENDKQNIEKWSTFKNNHLHNDSLTKSGNLGIKENANADDDDDDEAVTDTVADDDADTADVDVDAFVNVTEDVDDGIDEGTTTYSDEKNMRLEMNVENKGIENGNIYKNSDNDRVIEYRNNDKGSTIQQKNEHDTSNEFKASQNEGGINEMSTIENKLLDISKNKSNVMTKTATILYDKIEMVNNKYTKKDYRNKGNEMIINKNIINTNSMSGIETPTKDDEIDDVEGRPNDKIENMFDNLLKTQSFPAMTPYHSNSNANNSNKNIHPSAQLKEEITTTNWWHSLPYAEIRKFLNSIFDSVTSTDDFSLNGSDDSMVATAKQPKTIKTTTSTTSDNKFKTIKGRKSKKEQWPMWILNNIWSSLL